MFVGVGYDDTPDTWTAGSKATTEALDEARAGREDIGPCDFVLLFSTANHNPATLRDAVRSVLGADVPVVGGSASGAMCNDRFGYADD